MNNKEIIENKEEINDKNTKRIVEKQKKINNINLLESKLNSCSNKNEELTMRGRLIKELKGYLKVAHPSEINEIRYKIDKELEKHKQLCIDIRKQDKGKISIFKRVGLKIQEISDSIKIFLSKHDVIKKAESVLKSSAYGGAFSVAISSIIAFLSGTGIGIPILVSSLPVMAYMGISSIVRNSISKTSYQIFQYKKSDDYKELIKKIPLEFKEEYEKIRNLIIEKENANDFEKLRINKDLVEVYNTIKESSKVSELAQIFKLEKHNLLLENKKIYEEVIDNHLKDKKILSKQEYQTIVKEKLKNDISIFESENALKEAIKESGKSTKISAVTLLVARIIANFAIPGYTITSINDLLVPLGYILVNNLIGIINYSGKIKETKYNNKRIEINNKDRFLELANKNVKVANI